MPNTYSQLYAQLIFAVKGRNNFIQEEWSSELYKYMSGIVKGKSQKLYSVNGASDHIHLLVSYKPGISLSDLVRDVKSNSSGFINRKRFVNKKFRWQSGFGAFSYGKSQVLDVIRYIENQREHHKHRTFREEYIQFLKNFDVDFESDYLFEFYD